MVVLRDDLARVLDVALGQLGDVHETLDTLQDFDEGTKRDHLGGTAVHDVALLVALEDALPRVGLGLLETERDALAVAVDVEHLDLDLLTDLEELGRVVDVAPGQLGDVDQAVDAVEVDERAEIDDVRHDTRDGLARGEIVEDALANLTALLLKHGAARQHDVVARAVELDHLAAQLLTAELLEILHAADIDQRGRQEAADAEVDDQAALDDLDDRAVDGLAGLGGSLNALPRLLEAGALLRQDQAAVLILLLHDQSVDLFAHLDLVTGVNGAADAQLGDGNDTLALVADVDQDLVLVDAHNLAGDDVAFGELRDRRVVVRHHLAVDFDPDTRVCGDHLFFGHAHR